MPTYRLNGQNFLRCSQFMKLFVIGKPKVGYLVGAIKAPRRDYPTYSI